MYTQTDGYILERNEAKVAEVHNYRKRETDSDSQSDRERDRDGDRDNTIFKNNNTYLHSERLCIPYLFY